MSEFLPVEFQKRMRDFLGDEYPEFEKALEGARYRGLRVNPLKMNIDGSPASVGYPMVMGLENIPWEKNGYYYSETEEFRPGKHPLHEAGVYYIQEPSAMLPATLLEAKPGEKILDLCAAPGGKSTQIAAAMEGRGLLVSNEINPQRARILSENIERMGIGNAVVTNESPASLADRFEGFFDRIMVDAPCSGEGMFRKNDEAVGEWSPDNVRMCAERQAGILDSAAEMLRNGGRMVYSTCTFAEEENEKGIEAFIERHLEFKLVDMQRLWPHKIKGEGHFAAVLEKGTEAAGVNNALTAAVNEADGARDGAAGADNGAAAENIRSMSASDRKKVREYLGDILKEECFMPEGILGSGRLEQFGENIFLVPSAMLPLRGLKVLRPGLCLGSYKKERFEPAHSLALALDPALAKRVVDLTADEAADYIKGLTKNTDAEKGWTLVCVEGYSIGWGKSAGGILKNHYPKGLRKG